MTKMTKMVDRMIGIGCDGGGNGRVVYLFFGS